MSGARKWALIAMLMTTGFMTIIDNTVVNVALVPIQRDLHLATANLEWVVSAYVLSFAMLMMPAGRLGDLYGRRRVFLIGLLVFTAASAACALSRGPGSLIAGRAIQGVGAALMVPSTLAILSSAFSAGERGMAIGIWASVSAGATAIGPVLGGLVVEHLHWPFIFLINVPIGIAGLVAGMLVIPDTRGEQEGTGIDVPGLLLLTAVVFSVLFALIEAPQLGWGSPVVLGLFAVAAIGFPTFVAVERRAPSPMLDLGLFRNPVFAGANLVLASAAFSLGGMLFYTSLFLQGVLGVPSAKAGATFVPLFVTMMAVAPVAAQLARRVGAAWTVAAGLTVTAAGALLLSQLGQHAPYTALLAATATMGVGIGLATPLNALMLGAVPSEKAGVTSGLLTTVNETSSALGIAVLGAVVVNRMLAAQAGGEARPAAFVDGYSSALVLAVVLLLACAATALATFRGRAPEPDAAQPVPESVEEGAR